MIGRGESWFIAIIEHSILFYDSCKNMRNYTCHKKGRPFIFKNRMADSAYLKILLIHLCYVRWLTCVITLDTYSWGSNKFRNVKSVVAIETTFVMKIRWSGKEKTISFPTFPFLLHFICTHTNPIYDLVLGLYSYLFLRLALLKK